MELLRTTDYALGVMCCATPAWALLLPAASRGPWSYAWASWSCRIATSNGTVVVDQHKSTRRSTAAKVTTVRAASLPAALKLHLRTSVSTACGVGKAVGCTRLCKDNTALSREHSNTSAPRYVASSGSRLYRILRHSGPLRFGLCARELLLHPSASPTTWTSSVQPCSSLRCNQAAGIWPYAGSRTSPEQRPQAFSGHLCL